MFSFYKYGSFVFKIQIILMNRVGLLIPRFVSKASATKYIKQ